METVQAVLAYPLVRATVTGLTGAVVIDLIAFVRYKDPTQARAAFDWRIALFRYAQGAVGGFLGGLGISTVV